MRVPRCSLIAMAFLLLTTFLLVPPGAAKSVYKRGQVVRFEGHLTGQDGRPVSGLTVALEVSRRGFRLRGLNFRGRNAAKTEKYDALQLLATTDSAGRYVIDWNYDSYFNVFELLVALPIEQSTTSELEVLERHDITTRIEVSNPIVTPLQVEAGHFVEWLQGYLAGRVSQDESRIYREMGRPERFDVGPEDGESSWWYFAAGKVYHFADGELSQVTHFEPVLEDF